jgi:uncharacterized membrane protein YhaH (DUF805 family)
MNGGQINWTVLFLSSTGRLPRFPFLVAMALILTALILFESAVPEVLRWTTALAVYPGLLFVSACVLSKRLHDRGRSGWWAALILLAFAVVWQQRGNIILALFVLVVIWAAVELGLMPGEEGANRFGPNPQGAATPGLSNPSV